MTRAEAYTRALLGSLVRARQQFSLDALATLTPGLTAQERNAVLEREQEFARMWEARARERILKRHQADAGLETSLSMLPRERNILANHIAVSALRLTARADLAQLRTAGETHGFWLRSDRPLEQSCPECRERSGRLWPLDFLEQWGPPRHPNCGCKIVSPAAARAWGMLIDDPVALREALAMSDSGGMNLLGTYGALIEATTGVLESVHRIEAHARQHGLTAVAAGRLAATLREAMVPVWREGDHPRWPLGHPLGGQFRNKRVDIGEVPGELATPFRGLMRAAAYGDLSGVEGSYSDMVKAAKQMYSPGREDALRFATRARSAVFNPTNRRITTGEMIDLGGGKKIPMPLGIPTRGLDGPWGVDDSYQWELAPGALGAEHDGLVKAMKKMQFIVASELPDGTLRLHSSPRRTETQAGTDARKLEIMAPALRAMRIVEPGVDLADSTPIDPDKTEAPDISAKDSTWYPGVSTRMLGDTAENLIDAVSMRMWEMGLLDKGDKVDFPSLRSPDRNSPLDWVMGRRGIDVKAQSMRSVYPAAQQRADTIDKDQARPDKIREVARLGLQPSIVHALTDLDNDVAHLFLHDYPDRETVFKEIRPPMALVDRLVAGDLVPGDDETATTGPDAGRGEKRWIFLGTFRLAYNPFMARLDAPTPKDLTGLLNASRARAAQKRPLDVGPRGVLGPPVDRKTSAQATEEGIQARFDERMSRDDRIVALTRMNIPQDVIAAEFDVTQARVSQIVSGRRKLDPTIPKPSKGRKDRPGITDNVRRATAPARVMPQTGASGGRETEDSFVGGRGFRGPNRVAVGQGGLTQKQRLTREAHAHQRAGLSAFQIAKKMGLLTSYVQTLLAEPDPA